MSSGRCVLLGNIVIVAVLSAVTVLTGWLGWRAWHVRKAALKWSATPLTALLTVILMLIVVLVSIGMVKSYAPRENPVAELS